ncbi:NUDIX hydrolase [Nocardioides caldifontis]|uniref:NUDIX hydrolase n=1 Tax=Nocardioides caldifontis TaxID=2588938 RepID=UPI0011DF4316|nr:NUDIX hydrolase [Nocardioides caldifontis]
MSGLHADALAVLARWNAPDPRQAALRQEYVDHLRRRPDGLSRSCRPDHLTASTLVVSADGRSVLLTLHAKAGRWFQVGGHVEDGDATLAGAALREASEESGIAGLDLDAVPVHLDAHEVPFCGGEGARHLDVRFLAVAPEGARHAVSEESTDVRWWPVDALPSDEPSLRELVDLGLDRLGGHRARLDA